MLYIVGLEGTLKQEMSDVLVRVTQGLRPHTRAQYMRQFKLFLAYVLTRGIRELDAIRTVLLFTEFLASNSISYRTTYLLLSTCLPGTRRIAQHLVHPYWVTYCEA